MQVLKINDGKSYFIVDGSDIVPEELSRENLLKILNDIYETEEEIHIPQSSIVDEIRNPVEKEIVQQIIQKVSEFSLNIENIRKEVSTQFPDIT